MISRPFAVLALATVVFSLALCFLLTPIGAARVSEPAHPGVLRQSIQIATTTRNVELVGQIGGVAREVMVQGNYAYVTAGDAGLRIIDVSNPVQPQEVGVYTASGSVVDVDVADEHVYVGTIEDVLVDDEEVRKGKLHVVDVSNPTTLQELGVYELPNGAVGDVHAAGGHLYTMWSDLSTIPFQGGLQVIDISDPAALTVLGSYKINNLAGSIYVSEDTAYLTWRSCSFRAYSCEGGLDILDVSNPTAPMKVGSYNTSVAAYSVQVVNQLAYVTTYDIPYGLGYKNGLQMIDVSDPTVPVEVGIYHIPSDLEWSSNLIAVQDIHIAEDLVYAAAGEAGLRLIDVSDPTEPTEIGFYVVPASASDVYVANGLIYTTYGQNGLLILRVTPLVSESLSTAGGSLNSPLDRTVYDFSTGTFTDTVTVIHVYRYPSEAPPTASLAGIDHFFDITAVSSDAGEPVQPAQSYTVTVQYTDVEEGPAMDETLALYAWNGEQWGKETSSVVNVDANTVTATPDHFGLWAVLGETRQMFLPVIVRNEGACSIYQTLYGGDSYQCSFSAEMTGESGDFETDTVTAIGEDEGWK